MSGVCFVDTETTGLDPDRHEIWEVGLITPDGTEHQWFLQVDLGRADPVALGIGHFHERCPQPQRVTTRSGFASAFADLTRGMHLAGAVVSFDEERLRKLLRSSGACPEWHYHLIDVEALAVGWLCANKWTADLPWSSDELTALLGLAVPGENERHTALGDARWAKRIYERICGTQ